MSTPIIKFRGEDGTIHTVRAIRGMSTYELAVQAGYKGTLEEWLASAGFDAAIKKYVDAAIGDVDAAMNYLRSIIGDITVNPDDVDTAAALELINDLDDIVGV